MVHLTNRFLHLFLVFVAIGIFDLSVSTESTVYAAPTSAPAGRRDSQDARSALATRSRVVSSRSASSSFANFEITEEEKKTQTLPLTKFDQRSQRGHPLMLLQHHLNRANVKLAKMKGRAPPTVEELQSALDNRKRDILDSEIDKRGEGHMSFLTSSSNRFAPNRGRIGVRLKDGAINIDESETPKKRDDDDEHYLEERSSKTKAKSSSKSKSTSKSKTTSTRKAKAKATNKPVTTTIKANSATKSKSTSAAAQATTTVKTDDAKAANANGYPVAALAAANSNTVSKPKAVTATNSLGLAIEANDVGYIANVQIGSASTTFRMLIDSGSADTWIPSSSCTGCGSNHQKLGSAVSSTYVGQTSSPFSITYGTGTVSGFLGSDTMKIAGMTLKALPLAMITKESTDFSDTSVPFDGLMGLAKRKLSNSGNPTPIDALYSSKQVAATVMGYHLGRAADQNNDGEVTFGGVDGSKYTGGLLELPNISSEGFYEITIQGLSFGGKAISVPSGSTAILDTGTTLMVAPPAEAKLIHAQIPGSVYEGGGAYTIPCNTTQQLSFTFGGHNWAMNSEDMLFLPVNDNDLNGACISSISGGTVGAPNEWLLGASFLKNVYFATNAKANVIGLGTLA